MSFKFSNILLPKSCPHRIVIAGWTCGVFVWVLCLWGVCVSAVHDCFMNHICPHYSEFYIVGSVQYCSNSIALAIGLLQSCTKPSISCYIGPYHTQTWLYSVTWSATTYTKEVRTAKSTTLSSISAKKDHIVPRTIWIWNMFFRSEMFPGET